MTTQDDQNAEQTWLLRVHGRVQGVGYRDACMQKALAMGVRGWVRNRVDGCVEAMLQGSADQIAAMSDWLRDSVPGARVTGAESSRLHAPQPHFDSFERLPTL
jgi:acylphosphatase